jgi:hypothetical protein
VAEGKIMRGHGIICLLPLFSLKLLLNAPMGPIYLDPQWSTSPPSKLAIKPTFRQKKIAHIEIKFGVARGEKVQKQ